jgi:hypothetical protein
VQGSSSDDVLEVSGTREDVYGVQLNEGVPMVVTAFSVVSRRERGDHLERTQAQVSFR